MNEKPSHISWLKTNIQAEYSEKRQVSSDLQNALITKLKKEI